MIIGVLVIKINKHLV